MRMRINRVITLEEEAEGLEFITEPNVFIKFENTNKTYIVANNEHPEVNIWLPTPPDDRVIRFTLLIADLDSIVHLRTSGGTLAEGQDDIILNEQASVDMLGIGNAYFLTKDLLSDGTVGGDGVTISLSDIADVLGNNSTAATAESNETQIKLEEIKTATVALATQNLSESDETQVKVDALDGAVDDLISTLGDFKGQNLLEDNQTQLKLDGVIEAINILRSSELSADNIAHLDALSLEAEIIASKIAVLTEGDETQVKLDTINSSAVSIRSSVDSLLSQHQAEVDQTQVLIASVNTSVSDLIAQHLSESNQTQLELASIKAQNKSEDDETQSAISSLESQNQNEDNQTQLKLDGVISALVDLGNSNLSSASTNHADLVLAAANTASLKLQNKSESDETQTLLTTIEGHLNKSGTRTTVAKRYTTSTIIPAGNSMVIINPIEPATLQGMPLAAGQPITIEDAVDVGSQAVVGSDFWVFVKHKAGTGGVA